MVDFSGPGTPLSADGARTACDLVGVGLPELWAVLSVETSGCGFLPDRRPKILFERHIFSRLTHHQFDADDPDVSQPSQGGYGPSGSHQYDRLAAALQLDREAALQSASWGLGQVMGENFAQAGFQGVDEMVASMVASEANQLRAMAAFISANGMDQALKSHNWTGFARRYNGPNYAANNYDGLLLQFYQRYSSGPLPDLQVRAAQVFLTYKGFAPGAIDGVIGTKTTTAVKAFQASISVPQTGTVDDALLTALAA